MRLRINKKKTEIGLLCLKYELTEWYEKTRDYKPISFKNARPNYDTKAMQLGYVVGLEFALTVLRRYDIINDIIHSQKDNYND